MILDERPWPCLESPVPFSIHRGAGSERYTMSPKKGCQKPQGADNAVNSSKTSTSAVLLSSKWIISSQLISCSFISSHIWNENPQISLSSRCFFSKASSVLTHSSDGKSAACRTSWVRQDDSKLTMYTGDILFQEVWVDLNTHWKDLCWWVYKTSYISWFKLLRVIIEYYI